MYPYYPSELSLVMYKGVIKAAYAELGLLLINNENNENNEKIEAIANFLEFWDK